MSNNPLKIIPSADKTEKWVSDRKNQRQEATAKFNRLWLINPEQFNPLRNCMEVERVARTVALFPDLIDKKAADLGCGDGIISLQLRDNGATVDAVDVAVNALKHFEKHDCARIQLFQDYVPRTKLADDRYDLVVATELVAYLPKEEYRLFMSELARIVKANGKVICSTPIDTRSSDALERFAELSETEFQIDEWTFSYHKYWLWLNHLLDSPSRYVRASKDTDYRNLKLQERSGFSKTWFRWNSSRYLAWFWKIESVITNPLYRGFVKSRSLLLGLESLCKSISGSNGISHAIWIGKRRPLVEFTPKDDQPVERKGKQQVWE